jgi:maltose O-acetyltransferase
MISMKYKRFFLFVRYELGLWFIGLLTNWLPEITLTCKLRGFLGRFFLGKCGRNFQYGAHVRFLAPWGIEIGDNVYIAAGCWLSGGAKLSVEDEVLFGPYSIVSTGSHKFKNNSAMFGGFIRKPVRIGRGTWVASHVIVTPGVAIGKGNLVCAGAVVTRGTPDNVMIGGVPAKIIRERKDTDSNTEGGWLDEDQNSHLQNKPDDRRVEQEQ